MNIQFEAEVIEEQDGSLLLKLKTGFGDPIIRVCRERIEVVTAEKQR